MKTSIFPLPQFGPPDQLNGQRFRVARYTCTWTVLHYHRGGDWVCQEPDHGTTCNFSEGEIVAGLVALSNARRKCRGCGCEYTIDPQSEAQWCNECRNSLPADNAPII